MDKQRIKASPCSQTCEISSQQRDRNSAENVKYSELTVGLLWWRNSIWIVDVFEYKQPFRSVWPLWRKDCTSQTGQRGALTLSAPLASFRTVQWSLHRAERGFPFVTGGTKWFTKSTEYYPVICTDAAQTSKYFSKCWMDCRYKSPHTHTRAHMFRHSFPWRAIWRWFSILLFDPSISLLMSWPPSEPQLWTDTAFRPAVRWSALPGESRPDNGHELHLSHDAQSHWSERVCSLTSVLNPDDPNITHGSLWRLPHIWSGVFCGTRTRSLWTI